MQFSDHASLASVSCTSSKASLQAWGRVEPTTCLLLLLRTGRRCSCLYLSVTPMSTSWHAAKLNLLQGVGMQESHQRSSSSSGGKVPGRCCSQFLPLGLAHVLLNGRVDIQSPAGLLLPARVLA